MSDDDEYSEHSETESIDIDPVSYDDLITEDTEDINIFRKNYDKLLKENKSSLYLNKYEITKILCKRSEQLESGCLPLIKDYEIYNNVYDIAMEELKEKKIPYILKRSINGKYEYFKLEDLILI
jgi:DNA-directed RNA polymerase subunit K/omega